MTYKIKNKEVKRYRFQKLKPSDIEEMKKLIKTGVTQKALCKIYDVSISTIQYHLNPKTNAYEKKRLNDYTKNLTKEQKLKKIQKHKPYLKQYIKERYNNDEEFRNRFKKIVLKSQKKRRIEWKLKGLCSNCGRERKNKRWVSCERCRRIKRDRAKKMYVPTKKLI